MHKTALNLASLSYIILVDVCHYLDIFKGCFATASYISMEKYSISHQLCIILIEHTPPDSVSFSGAINLQGILILFLISLYM